MVSPSVAPYCSTCRPSFFSISSIISCSCSMGKLSGAGSPPAKEIISGFCVSFSSSRMAERRIRPALSEKSDSRFLTIALGF